MPRRLVTRAPLAQLELLIAVRDHGSVSAAARALQIAQPTVSTGLARLEKHLEITLTAPSHAGTFLTDDGVTIALWAERVLAQSTAFERAARALRQDGGGRVAVAASHTVGEYLVPRWIGAAAGVLSVDLSVKNSVEVVAEVRGGRADIGFIESPTVPGGLGYLNLREDPLIAVVSCGHRLAHRSSPVLPSELLRQDLVLRERGSGTGGVFENALARLGLRTPAGAGRVASTAAIISSVLHAGKLAVVSPTAVEGEISRGTMVQLPLSGLDLRRWMRAVWEQNRPPTGGAKLLLEAAVKVERAR